MDSWFVWKIEIYLDGCEHIGIKYGIGKEPLKHFVLVGSFLLFGVNMKACSFFWILKRLVNVKNVKQINIDTGNTDEEIRHRVHFKKDATDRKGNKEKTGSCLFLRWEA